MVMTYSEKEVVFDSGSLPFYLFQLVERPFSLKTEVHGDIFPQPALATDLKLVFKFIGVKEAEKSSHSSLSGGLSITKASSKTGLDGTLFIKIRMKEMRNVEGIDEKMIIMMALFLWEQAREFAEVPMSLVVPKIELLLIVGWIE